MGARTTKNKLMGFNPADDAHTSYRNGLLAAANSIKDSDSRDKILDMVIAHQSSRKTRPRSKDALNKVAKSKEFKKKYS